MRVVKQLYKKSFKDIEVLDNGVIKKMQQIIKEPSGKMEFDCDQEYYNKYLRNKPEYSLKDAAKADKQKDAAKAE